mmetsp:Transcript_108502/g.324445  ORF Transcript_108502/g.324445 Transcript_108502/m.324445 type:complete len:398 (-) Transcript_108502:53-1246(-)
MDEAWVEGFTAVLPITELEEGFRGCGADARLQEDPRHTHAVDVPHAHGWEALGRDERGEANAEEDLVVVAQEQRGLQVVDAGGQHHVEANAQPLVDRSCGVCGSRHVDLLEAHHRAPGEVNALAVALDQGDVQVVLPLVVHADERLLRDHGGRVDGDRGGLLGGEAAMLLWRSLCADVDHVPDAARGALAQLRVARAVLLLAGGLERPADLHVANETTAGVAHADSLLVFRKVQVAINDGPTNGSCLRGGPEHVSAGPEVLGSAPEGAQRAEDVPLVALLAVDAALCIEDDITWLPAEAQDLRVVAHGDVHRVLAWLEEEGVTRGRELTVVDRLLPAILPEGLLDGRLDVLRVVLRPENLDAGRPDWRVRPALHQRRREPRRGRSQGPDQPHAGAWA